MIRHPNDYLPRPHPATREQTERAQALLEQRAAEWEEAEEAGYTIEECGTRQYRWISPDRQWGPVFDNPGEAEHDAFEHYAAGSPSVWPPEKSSDAPSP